MNIVARFGLFLRDLGNAIAEAAGAPRTPEEQPPAQPRVRISIPDDRPMFVPVGTFRNRAAAQDFSAILKQHEIENEIGPSPMGRGFAVGVPPALDEAAVDHLENLYGVPEDFPEDQACPSCDLRIIEDLEMPGMRWRCLRCGQIWQ